jgi:MFS family permease
MVSNALWGVIWPALLAQMSGDKYKTLAFAAGGQICTVVGYSHPFIGSWSDRLPADHFIVRLFRGRRRPFIACGGFVASFGVWMTYDALYRIVERPQTCYGHDPAWSQIESRGQCVAAGGSWGAAPLPHTTVVLAYLELALSLVIGNSGAAIWTPPYNAIIAETVPLRQRGTCVMVTSWVNTVTGIFSGSIAYMVGEQLSCSFESPPAGFDVKDQQWEGACFTAKQIWWCDIWILIGQIPFYMLCCNGRACDGCSWNGIFKPEKEIKRPALDTSSTTDTRTRRQRWRDEWNGFTAAFTDPCYKWLWIQGFVGQIGGLISNQFQFYWYQDCFNQCTGCKNAVAGQALVQGACTVVKNVTKCTPHFYFFHWQVASTAVGATAFNKLISQILHILILPMIRPDYWRDRFGGRPLLIWTGFAGLGLIQPFIYAWLTGNEYLYTLIQMWSVWGTFLGVINTAAGGSLMMDCLPSDDEGRPLSASRDLAFHEWAGRILGAPVNPKPYRRHIQYHTHPIIPRHACSSSDVAVFWR